MFSLQLLWKNAERVFKKIDKTLKIPLKNMFRSARTFFFLRKRFSLFIFYVIIRSDKGQSL